MSRGFLLDRALLLSVRSAIPPRSASRNADGAKPDAYLALRENGGGALTARSLQRDAAVTSPFSREIAADRGIRERAVVAASRECEIVAVLEDSVIN